MYRHSSGVCFHLSPVRNILFVFAYVACALHEGPHLYHLEASEESLCQTPQFVVYASSYGFLNLNRDCALHMRDE